MRVLPLCLLPLALAGCLNSFDPGSFVTDLRLFQVVADPPEIGGGQGTMLYATAHAPGGGPVAIHWSRCLAAPDPTSGAVSERCRTQPLSDGATFVAVGDGDSVAFTMPGDVDPTKLGLPDGSGGVYVPLRLDVSAGANALTAFYRLRYYIQTLPTQPPIQNPNPPNRNPALKGIYEVPAGQDPPANAPPEQLITVAPDMPLEVHSGDEIKLRALVADGSAEQYQTFDLDTQMVTTKTETMRITWYATAGRFSEDNTGPDKPDTKLKLEKDLPAPGSLIDVWIVLRDDRGGGDVTHRTLLLR